TLIAAPASAAKADLALADAQLRQHIFRSADRDAGRAAAQIMDRGGNGDAQAVAAIPGPFPTAGLFGRGLTRREVVPAIRHGGARKKNKSKSRFPINPHR